ncbi:hypothetical protein EBESD8_6540 [Rhodococcus aetherivorans]|nr:hypothetical protein EBESD8_6540 [Rhodococcus aetherivorans]
MGHGHDARVGGGSDTPGTGRRHPERSGETRITSSVGRVGVGGGARGYRYRDRRAGAASVGGFSLRRCARDRRFDLRQRDGFRAQAAGGARSGRGPAASRTDRYVSVIERAGSWDPNRTYPSIRGVSGADGRHPPMRFRNLFETKR